MNVFKDDPQFAKETIKDYKKIYGDDATIYPQTLVISKKRQSS